MSSSTTYKQDLPPDGGYKKLDFSRVPARKIWNWYTIIPTYVVSTAVGIYLWRLNREQVRRERAENNSATVALMPLLIAEKDRNLLKTMRKIRDEETELMKNTEGWEAGTLYGEKVYKTSPEDEFVMPSFNEYYAHNKNEEFTKRFQFFFRF
ncbi:NADH dehydrogenase [ubiquinone] 1 alpha subcomplex subunit 13 [Diaphorina citri]|uniref:NADH dehydrogenase [ubiquinone] 1 alpha subcomplex subunit 13 n=1 Tax=Diaphorina citri TaxID=121845 RepID=A0A1S3D7R1_DIACI|nr:NADH dehydrogenase [ubiquinone] 1 alpha subcomplex subunit 13 [Diaphorina citri]KAI5695801.1 hypothetical protein M8J75_003811 [Diaphorina citri]KAI5699183.1 hypothetical protein M8J77_014642 [Diaphorina citri]KAI5722939.1 hypothetical protein M8J76_015882 [Diaphorina citri]KAI5724995.1 hypothetical protein M8J77_009935 [Diaphorina citri]